MLNSLASTGLTPPSDQTQRVTTKASGDVQTSATTSAATDTTAATTTAAAQPSPEELKRISDELQRHTADAAPELKFAIDSDSGKTVIQITDSTTNKVIRQIPSEEALQISQDLDRFQKGLLVNRKA